LPIALLGCSALGFEAVYPARPPSAPGEAFADPPPSRIVMHATVTGAALKKSLEEAVPKTGDGTFPFIRGDRKFTWTRGPADVRFTQGRIDVSLHVDANADMPISS